MHDHNKDGRGKGMLWMMVPCLLLVGVLFLGGGKLSGGGYFWPILIGVFVVAYVWMMSRGHGSKSSVEDHAKKKPPRDPVCGMRASDVITLVYKEQTYAFCSDHCRSQFEKNPEAYAVK